MDASRIARMLRYFKQCKPTLLLQASGRWVCIGQTSGVSHACSGDTAEKAYAGWEHDAEEISKAAQL